MRDKSVDNVLKWLRSATRVTVCVAIAVMIGLVILFAEFIAAINVIVDAALKS